MDVVDGKKRKKDNTYINRSDPMLLTGSSGLFSLTKRVELEYEFNPQTDDAKFQIANIKFFNDPLSDPNYLMMLAMTMSPSEIAKKFKRPKVELLNISCHFSQSSYMTNGIHFASLVNDSSGFEQQIVDIFDKDPGVPEGLFYSGRPLIPTIGELDAGSKGPIYRRDWPDQIKFFEAQYYRQYTAYDHPIEEKISLKIGKKNLTTEGTIVGELEEDVTLETEQDEDVDVTGNDTTYHPIFRYNTVGKPVQKMDYTDGAGHGQFLKGNNLVVAYIHRGTYSDENDTAKPLLRLYITYRTHYVEMLEEEINRLLEEQNNVDYGTDLA